MFGNNHPLSSVKICYFSGTGGTKKVAESLEQEFAAQNVSTQLLEIRKGQDDMPFAADLLVILFPVHAFNAPQYVYTWINRVLSHGNGMPAAIIAVSGGGETSPNTACRVGCKRRLKKKGYCIVYEDMIIMPSNFSASTPELLSVALFKALPIKCKKIVSNLTKGKMHLIKPAAPDHAFSVLGKAEALGAKLFGKLIRADEHCNQCGICVKGCPKQNIALKDGKITFGYQCVFCMRCLYSCPQNALSPRLLKMAVIKDGYRLNQLEAKAQTAPDMALQEVDAGKEWNGIKTYLEEVYSQN